MVLRPCNKGLEQNTATTAKGHSMTVSSCGICITSIKNTPYCNRTCDWSLSRALVTATWTYTVAPKITRLERQRILPTRACKNWLCTWGANMCAPVTLQVHSQNSRNLSTHPPVLVLTSMCEARRESVSMPPLTSHSLLSCHKYFQWCLLTVKHWTCPQILNTAVWENILLHFWKMFQWKMQSYCMQYKFKNRPIYCQC
jgi:hypothetical protein